MWKRTLLGYFGVVFAFEIIFAFAGFFAPEFTLLQFGISANSETLFLAFCLAWLLLLVSAVCLVAMYHIRTTSGYLLTLVLGIWWIGIGIGIFLKTGKVENLFLDSVKGAGLLFLNWKAHKHPTK